MAFSKYGNKKASVDGIKFDSIKESKRYGQLVLLEKGKVISDLKLQHRFDIVVNERKICTYVADFTYYENGVLIVEDVKSEFTRKMPLYRIKMKLMEAVLNIKIKES